MRTLQQHAKVMRFAMVLQLRARLALFNQAGQHVYRNVKLLSRAMALQTFARLLLRLDIAAGMAHAHLIPASATLVSPAVPATLALMDTMGHRACFALAMGIAAGMARAAQASPELVSAPARRATLSLTAPRAWRSR